jgi:pyruvate,water dikinase
LVKELSEFCKKEEPFKKTQLFKMMERVLKLVVPLNLINPQDEKFKPEYCETFHDIIRFAHQKAMQEMFGISGELPEDVEEVKLITGLPLPVYVIDLGNGIESGQEKPGPAHIRSVPFKAFLKGLSSLAWPEPRHVDVKGFLGMMAHTASVPEEELGRMAEESFAFIAGSI